MTSAREWFELSHRGFTELLDELARDARIESAGPALRVWDLRALLGREPARAALEIADRVSRLVGDIDDTALVTCILGARGIGASGARRAARGTQGRRPAAARRRP